jgi:hypothetical protein
VVYVVAVEKEEEEEEEANHGTDLARRPIIWLVYRVFYKKGNILL